MTGENGSQKSETVAQSMAVSYSSVFEHIRIV